MQDRKPPRHNRYHAYLAVFGLLMFPVLGVFRMPRVCGWDVYGAYPMRRCTYAQTWQWLLAGGNTEAWVVLGLAAALTIVFVVGVFSDP